MKELRGEAVMKKMMGIIGLVLLFSGVGLKAQGVPKVEVFGGYSYLNIDTNNLTSRQNANGWETSVSGNFNKWLAAEFDVSGYYKTYSGVRVTDYSYLAGPRLNFRLLFVHGLLGGDHLNGSVLGYSASQDSLAGAIGGGVQLPFTRLMSFRASADYVFSRHNILGGPSVTQNNFRVSSGVVFTFGGRREVSGRVPSPQPTPTVQPPPSARRVPGPQPTPTAQPPLSAQRAISLGFVGYATDDGFKVTSVREGSPATQIFLRPGDVISKIDDKEVKNDRDIESAVAASTSGTIKVTGLDKAEIGGYGDMIQFEREIKVR